MPKRKKPTDPAFDGRVPTPPQTDLERLFAMLGGDCTPGWEHFENGIIFDALASRINRIVEAVELLDEELLTTADALILLVKICRDAQVSRARHGAGSL